MQSKLPESADFLKEVQRNTCYQGRWPVSRFERLRDIICDHSGEVEVRLKFGVSAGTRCLDGQVVAELALRCERCLNPVNQHIDSGFRFGLVVDEDEASLLPKEFEPLVLADGEQSLIELVEDELLLSLPIVAKHDRECSEILRQHQNDRNAQADTYKPFAALKDLMN